MELREVVAKNICDLRVRSGLTQLQFAEILNYSDKAISKWERAESVPDIFVLKQVADFFGVSVDYLLKEEHNREERPQNIKEKMPKVFSNLIIAISLVAIWFFAVAYYITQNVFFSTFSFPSWLTFIYAVFLSALVWLVLNSTIGGTKSWNFLILTVLIWSFLLSVYLTLITVIEINLWFVFILGVPAQVAVVLVFLFTKQIKKIKGVQRVEKHEESTN